MNENPAMVTDEQLGQRIEGLKKRYAARKDLKLLKTADATRFRAELTQAMSDAKNEFGMDDVDRLRGEVVAIRTDNVAKVDAFEAALDAVDAKLRAIGAAI